MTRDYAGEIRDRMIELDRWPRPRHQHLIRDANSELTVCRIVMLHSATKELRYVYTFGRCHEPEWIADDIRDRRTIARLREHSLDAWSRGSTTPLLVADGKSDAEAALAFTQEMSAIARWMRRENGTDTPWLLARARGVDEVQEAS